MAGSTVKDLADAEAARAEADGDADAEPELELEPDPAGEPEPDPDGDPAEPAAVSERDIAARNDKLHREDERHRERVAAIMGDDSAVLAACPLCLEDVSGFVAPPGLVDYTADERLAVLMVLGEDAPAPLRDAEGVKTCERCDGYGQLRYPTKVPHTELQNCPVCSGAGYVPVEQADQPGAHVIQLPAPPAGVGAPLQPQFGADSWGRPIGHPHYGRLPAEVTG